MMRSSDYNQRLSRAQGCLLGQLAGDSLGGLVEFQTPERIHADYPDGVRDMAAGGTWNTLAGQPTDDSEMALALARSLVERHEYFVDDVRSAYQQWLASEPFDLGATCAAGLRGRPNLNSQANGALMRISPLGIFCAGLDDKFPETCASGWATNDCVLTHPNPVCVGANVLFTMAITNAIRTGPTPELLYGRVLKWAMQGGVVPTVLSQALLDADDAPPDDYVTNMGWVLVAFQNAFWQLLHARSLEEALVDTVGRGGDTDTNAAICGALLGAVHGLKAVPERWVGAILKCEPEAGRPGVHRPRPRHYWPNDALSLAADLLRG